MPASYIRYHSESVIVVVVPTIRHRLRHLKGAMLIAILAFILTTALSYALPWIEDSDYDEKTYSWAYAYVGAYTTGEKLVNVKHDYDGGPYETYKDIPALVSYYPYTSPDYTYAYTRTEVLVDPDGNGIYQLDAKAKAEIYASRILSK